VRARGGMSAGSARAAWCAAGALALIVLVAPALIWADPDSSPAAGAPRARSAAADPLAARYRLAGCRSSGTRAYRHGPPRRAVAIGFDDGPWTDTPAFVRMLERAHARATFFLIGRQLGPANRATLLRELADGDALGDHTFTHPYLTATRSVRAQLASTIAAIRALTGYTPCVFRPPYGAYDASVVRIARALGLATVLRNVDPADWSLPGRAAIERRVLAQVQPGSIVISHDGGGPRTQTLAAYPRIIAALRRRRFQIVTIPQLLGFRPVYVPCVRLCDGIGVARGAVPHDAVIEGAP
jgi:peptidoglycan/xylan/chitin deacetylase (PgdA/CDA1 family)